MKGEGMGYKKWGKEISFADLAVSKSLEHNRSLKMMMSIDKVVKWRDVVLFTRIVRQGCKVLFRPIEAGVEGFVSKGFGGFG
jgi:hypothetical protein